MGDRQGAVEDLDVTTAAVSAECWRGRRVLLTGHTGFKGAWTALWLSALGADVVGLALPPETEPALFTLLGALPGVDSRFADIRDPAAVAGVVADAAPEVVIHMAAQALVFRSYREPAETFATNVLGTVHLLEALRRAPSVRAIFVVTSDKVYADAGDGRPHRETDPLGGADPYSASKAACEIAVASWSACYFAPRGVPLATARAGNVIGGGDWSEHRLVPDVWRAAWAGADPMLRHPEATRPWQHVLDCVAGYFVYVQALLQAPAATLPLALNFGPPAGREAPVAAVADAMLASLGGGRRWTRDPGAHPPERHALQLDAGLAERTLGWRARLDLAQTLAWTADWYRAFDRGADIARMSLAQIAAYQAMCAT